MVVILGSNESKKPSLLLGDTYMKRLILSAALVAITATALTPAAFAGQASTAQEVSDSATIHELVRHNRRVRDK